MSDDFKGFEGKGEGVTVSRRSLLGGLGSGLAVAAVAAGPSFGQSGAGSVNTSQPVQDPTTKYPKPPYKYTRQPWPGLASKMEPPPDHGETSYKGSGRLTGRKALITGGDSGMGRAAAIAYAREGADVAINYFPTEEPDAKQVVALIRAEGRKAVAIPGDLRDEKFCKSLAGKAMEGLGGLDILVMNAGRQQSFDSILEMPDQEFDWIMKTNIYAPYYIIKSALPNLKPGSCIIATTSEQAYNPDGALYAYAQTKAATMNYVKSLAKQLGPKGIRVNGVAPGPFYTPLQIFRAGRARRSSSTLARSIRWDERGSRRSWRRCMCSWRRRMLRIRRGISMGREVGMGSRKSRV